MSERDRGAFVEMEEPCVDCKQMWGMYESEIRFFENLIKTEGYTMPKRCPACRKKKKAAKEQKVSLHSVLDNLRRIAKAAREGAYTFHDDVLADEVTEVADELQILVKNSRKKELNEQPTESVS